MAPPCIHYKDIVTERHTFLTIMSQTLSLISIQTPYISNGTEQCNGELCTTICNTNNGKDIRCKNTWSSKRKKRFVIYRYSKCTDIPSFLLQHIPVGLVLAIQILILYLFAIQFSWPAKTFNSSYYLTGYDHLHTASQVTSASHL